MPKTANYKAGDVVVNPITGERGVVRLGASESHDGSGVYDLYVQPGGAVAGEHIHPNMLESFTVLRGRVGFRIDGKESIVELGAKMTVPIGVAHDWWNVGDEEAHVLVEVYPAARFEEAITDLFGLARNGKTNTNGMPKLLQGALFAREYKDVLYFTKPPLWVQNILFAVLAPIAKLLGYQGSYPEYRTQPRGWVEVEPWPLTDKENGRAR
ncbi:Cupin 2 conserved barrel domain protein (plasmid) [Herpetosiphon aurantiacus DSM 785]|uniref:Cupin 2 conserved barrel domain protein n=1 Tax=Herpetosiphon aurantiacus (strain ATCC 23779 / DSM 785 / 114-95) TaxID=316274 RepID=A9B8J4_HERA2|nr:Cupin 2 conserved barrel domain protein [Herpetosiphon aurantiacus DSM 785]